MKKVAIAGWAGFIKWHAVRCFAGICPFYPVFNLVKVTFARYPAVFMGSEAHFGYKFDEPVRMQSHVAELLTFATVRPGSSRLYKINKRPKLLQ